MYQKRKRPRFYRKKYLLCTCNMYYLQHTKPLDTPRNENKELELRDGQENFRTEKQKDKQMENTRG